MSYTVTLDIPKKTELYVKRQGARFQKELNMLFSAIVSAKMKCDADSEGLDETPGPRLLASFQEADEMEAGIRPRQDFKTVDELMADCLS